MKIRDILAKLKVSDVELDKDIIVTEDRLIYVEDLSKEEVCESCKIGD